MYFNIFLDDERFPEKVTWVQLPKVHWEIIRDYDQFVQIIIERGLPIHISFDHDLAAEHYNPEMYQGQEAYDRCRANFKEKTGLECAKWLVKYCMERSVRVPMFTVHSMNPIGAANITSYLNSYNRSLESI